MDPIKDDPDSEELETKPSIFDNLPPLSTKDISIDKLNPFFQYDKICVYNPFKLTYDPNVTRLLAFSMEGTLIINREGFQNPTSPSDMKFFCPGVREMVYKAMHTPMEKLVEDVRNDSRNNKGKIILPDKSAPLIKDLHEEYVERTLKLTKKYGTGIQGSRYYQARDPEDNKEIVIRGDNQNHKFEFNDETEVRSNTGLTGTNHSNDGKVAIVIFSNNKGKDNVRGNIPNISNRIGVFFTELFKKDYMKIPAIALFSLDTGYYRKPNVGMFEFLRKYYYPNINPENSLYVGNHAGRINREGCNFGDFSDADYKFALNTGMKFLTPEEFFLKAYIELSPIKFDPKVFCEENNNLNTTLNKSKYYDILHEIKVEKEDRKKNICLMFIAPKGSRTKQFFNNYFLHYGYYRVNTEELGGIPKCKDKLLEYCGKKYNVVVDNPMATKAGRLHFLKIAKKNKYRVIGFHFTYSKELALHLNNHVRNLETLDLGSAWEKNKVEPAFPDVKWENEAQIESYFNQFEEITVDEGFERIIKVNYEAGPFADEADRRLFYMYTELFVNGVGINDKDVVVTELRYTENSEITEKRKKQLAGEFDNTNK